jgi:hypothetical protein
MNPSVNGAIYDKNDVPDLSTNLNMDIKESPRAAKHMVGDVSNAPYLKRESLDGVEEAKQFAKEAMDSIDEIGLPAIIRPAFTMGGTGVGIAYNPEEFVHFCTTGLLSWLTSQTHQLIHLAQLLFFALLVLSKLTQKKHLNGINLVKQKSFYQN